MTHPDPVPSDESVSIQLAAARYKNLRSEWRKAYDRLGGDPDGAVTAARSLMESTCKTILDATSASYDQSWDLPKLYTAASKQLGIAASIQTDRIFRSVFGAAHTIVQSIGELRNVVGDAHGKGLKALRASPAHAELAVNLAGSVTSFLVSILESHLAATHRLDADGRAILRFDKALVWRLRDHARNSATWSKCLGERRAKPALWLVGDAGVYLMSNGKPPISYDGVISRSEKPCKLPYLTAPASGCDPKYDEVEDWWPIHNAIEGGDDFVRPIPIGLIDGALEEAEQEVVIVADQEELIVYGDVEFDALT